MVLKAFHETSPFCFIIIGVWLEENRLIVYNGDLEGRLVAVDADKWKAEELDAVITVGRSAAQYPVHGRIPKKELLAESFESCRFTLFKRRASAVACEYQSGCYGEDPQDLPSGVIGEDVDVKWSR